MDGTSEPEASTETDSTERLIAIARTGSIEALERLLEMFRDQLWLLVDRELGDRLRAKLNPSDLVQDTLLDVHQAFGQFNGQTASELFAWICQILRNNLLDAHKFYDRDKRDVGREVPIGGEYSTASADPAVIAPDRPPDENATAAESAAVLDRALARLSPQHRQVILLRNREGWPFPEIGAYLNISTDAARKLWVRAVDKLQADGELRNEWQ